MKCKICGKSLYDNITFANLFKRNYQVHFKCIDSLKFSADLTYLPFSEKHIIIDSVFEYVQATYDACYLETKYMEKAFNRLLCNDTWSIVLYLNKNDVSKFKYSDYEILFSLSKYNVYIISFDQKLIFHLENNL